MNRKAALLLLVCGSVWGAEFRTGQAARAVLGQSSFSSHDAGVNAISLVVAGDRLYAAEASHRTYIFDLSKLADVQADRSANTATNCAVCIPNAIAETAHSVMPGVGAVSVWGKTVAIADAAHHRVLIWRDATASRLDRGPDLILGSADSGTLVDPVSVALDDRHVFVGDAALHRVLIWNTLPASNDQAPDEVLGQLDFGASDEPTAASVGVPTAMVSDGADLLVADAAAHRVLVFSPGDNALRRGQVVNSASLSAGPIAPGTLVTITSKGMASESISVPSDSDEPLPRELGGVEVILDGVALPLLSVTPDEVQALVPVDFASGSAASLLLRSERAGVVRVTNAIDVAVAPASPGIFALGGSEPRSGLLLHEAGKSPVTGEYPARPGETLTIWATGLGAVLEDRSLAVPLSAQLDGEALTVLSAKLAEHSAGVYEVQIALPSAWSGALQAHLAITQNGATSNTVSFPVTAPHNIPRIIQ